MLPNRGLPIVIGVVVNETVDDNREREQMAILHPAMASTLA